MAHTKMYLGNVCGNVSIQYVVLPFQVTPNSKKYAPVYPPTRIQDLDSITITTLQSFCSSTGNMDFQMAG